MAAYCLLRYRKANQNLPRYRISNQGTAADCLRSCEWNEADRAFAERKGFPGSLMGLEKEHFLRMKKMVLRGHAVPRNGAHA